MTNYRLSLRRDPWIADMLLNSQSCSRPSAWGVAKRYITTFLVTAIAVYAWVATHREPTAVGGTARATITVPIGGQRVVVVPDAWALRSQLTTDQFLAQALVHAEERWSVPRSMEKIRQGLKVDIRRGGDEAVTISLSLTDNDLAFASGVVNALVDHCTEGFRTQVRDEARTKHQLAAEALGETREKLRQARAELDGFLERHFREHDDLGRRVAANGHTSVQRSPSAVQSTPIDNPDWLRLHEQIQMKRRTLTELLSVRTPLHPDVQERQSEVADLERRLAEIPRQVVRSFDEGFGAPSPAVAVAPAVQPPATESFEAARTFASLSAKVRQAAENEPRLAEAERVAWQEQYSLPTVKTTSASQPAVAAAATGKAGVFWVALISGMAVASGVGMIFSRPASDRRITSLIDAERSLGAPVLGVIRIADLPDEPLAESGPSRRRMLLVLIGVVCVVAAILLVVLAG